ncbi:MAG: hypothetical protein II275_06620 [Bacteroidaceae bacterium]|nr:hypothetical protein [Bacteroidaceae bacterium]
MEKTLFSNVNIAIESKTEMNENTAQLGWLTRGAASDFYFAQKRTECIGVRRSHTLHRRDGVNISRHDNGNYRITITLPSHTQPEVLMEELCYKASQAAEYFNR